MQSEYARSLCRSPPPADGKKGLSLCSPLLKAAKCKALWSGEGYLFAFGLRLLGLRYGHLSSDPPSWAVDEA